MKKILLVGRMVKNVKISIEEENGMYLVVCQNSTTGENFVIAKNSNFDIIKKEYRRTITQL